MSLHQDERLRNPDIGSEVDGSLAEAFADARLFAEEAIDTARLEGQRAAIVERLHVRRAGGRVLPFPSRPGGLHRPRQLARWVALAAAAGLIVGLGMGQLVGPQLFGGSPRSGQAAWSAVNRSTRSGAANDRFQPERLDAQEERFLAEMEMVVNNRRVRELRALDTLTPRPADFSRGQR
jgi:hypothetical protein